MPETDTTHTLESCNPPTPPIPHGHKIIFLHALSLSTAMVNWGEVQNKEIIDCIKRGDINPHNLDGAYLFGKMVQLFKGFDRDRTPKSRANVIEQLCKKLRNYVFNGTMAGRRKRAVAGELFILRPIFLLALPIHISYLLPSSMFQSWVTAVTAATTTMTTT